MSLLKLFLVFVKIGAILLGGGYVILPIMQNEFAEKLKVVKSDELINYYALSQSLPGIVAANMAIFIGYKLRGKTGALACMTGIIFVPFWSIILLASVLHAFVANVFINSALWGIGVAVIVLIMLSVREIWQNSNRNYLFYTLFLLTLTALLALKLSPAIVIILFSLLGLMIKIIQRRLAK